MNISFGASEFIASLSLLVSLVTYFSQRGVNTRQARLNDHLLAQAVAEMEAAKKAELDASFVKVPGTSGGVVLKVFNRGKATARNVKFEFLKPQFTVFKSELDVFPLATLGPQRYVDLRGATHLGSTEKKLAVRLQWSDDHSDTNERVVHPTL